MKLAYKVDAKMHLTTFYVNFVWKIMLCSPIYVNPVVINMSV